MSGPDDGFTVSDAQWAALELVVRRADEHLSTYVARTAVGDAAITRKTAAALMRRGFINVTASNVARPTRGGRAALEAHRRLQGPR